MLGALELAWVRALHADDPLAALTHEAAGLDPGDRAAALAAAGDGFVLTSLLVKKLRFEAIVRGDEKLERWFESDPRGFTEAFRSYAREVPPRPYFPAAAAAAFHGWCCGKGIEIGNPGGESSVS